MIKGVTTKDKDRPVFSLAYHPIIGNSTDKVAVTISLDQDFIQENKGSKNVKGLTDTLGAGNSITLVMDAKAAMDEGMNKRLNIVGALERTAEDLEMEANGRVLIDEFGKYGGTAELVKEGNRIKVNTSFLAFDENGQPIMVTDSNFADPNATAGSITQMLRPVLRKQYEDNYKVSEILRMQNPNLVFDPNAFSK
jgi:hypothetical protein